MRGARGRRWGEGFRGRGGGRERGVEKKEPKIGPNDSLCEKCLAPIPTQSTSSYGL